MTHPGLDHSAILRRFAEEAQPDESRSVAVDAESIHAPPWMRLYIILQVRLFILIQQFVSP